MCALQDLHAFKNIEFAVYCPPHDKVLKKLMEMLDNLVTWQYNGSKSTIDPLMENIDDEYKEC